MTGASGFSELRQWRRVTSPRPVEKAAALTAAAVSSEVHAEEPWSASYVISR